VARYTSSYLVKLPLGQLESLLKDLFYACHFEMIYHTLDYIMAKEIPGEVPFSKLVTVEVLIDSTMATKNEVQVNLVVKNDELPLQLNNHCRQMFDRIQQAIAEHQQWQWLENVTS
jgi:hypothetical protein